MAEPMTDNRLAELQIDAHHPAEVYELTDEVVRLRVEIERMERKMDVIKQVAESKDVTRNG